jgi:hypothetical protein
MKDKEGSRQSDSDPMARFKPRSLEAPKQLD